MQEWIPPHANLALLNHVKSAFGIPCIEFAGKAEEDYGRWKEASYTPVLTQEERSDQKEILHQYMLDAATGEAFCLLRKDFGYEKSDFMESETVFAGTEPTHYEKGDAINRSLKMD